MHLSRSLDGWWVLSGLLSPEDGQVLHAALEAGVDRRLRAAHDGDPSVEGRPVSSWRAEALVDLAAQSMRREPSDRSVPDRYRIGLLLTPADLEQAPCTALCDSPVYRAVMGAQSDHTFIHQSLWRVVIPSAGAKPQVLRPDATPLTVSRHHPSWQVHHAHPPRPPDHAAA